RCSSSPLSVLLFTTSRSFCSCDSSDHPALHSFPTRRSSDLLRAARTVATSVGTAAESRACRTTCRTLRSDSSTRAERPAGGPARSEEHTSELQSHLMVVYRLLPDKKTTPAPPAIRGGLEVLS